MADAVTLEQALGAFDILAQQFKEDPERLGRFKEKFAASAKPDQPLEENQEFFNWAVGGQTGEKIAAHCGYENKPENHVTLWKTIREKYGSD
eukprot:CAMPEP_0114545302 /NCGR_PEP_ID=MMETSP0114-20121206/3327_1 /TAXON_ID=31324 /ORGANISM="Goniomonas sp, Strain m" /LENGTH=91 /DNA_ID=CAMNT_0001729719 /DNA_START=6 /DNA_END=278 /DNA_ORIENTATION=+